MSIETALQIVREEGLPNEDKSSGSRISGIIGDPTTSETRRKTQQQTQTGDF
jgi:hypothetical protein